MTHLVLLHGWGASAHIWQRQVEVFGEKCTVLAPRISQWDASWLKEYLTRLPLENSVLVGWSLGGMLLLEALSQFALPAPSATVLVGVPAIFCRRPDHPFGQPPALVRAMRLGLKSGQHRVLTDFLASCLAPGEEGFREEAAAGFDIKAGQAHLAQGLDYLKEKDLRELLPHVSAKVVIVQGEKDGIVEPAQAQFLQEQIANASLQILPGAGHLPFLSQAEAFNGILRKLLLDL
ncbi:MAG: alpha/beta hydrolase [Deltaproteobacteria bacterium]|nr:alpha/beta hydrolase [Deltaproteobacteria bacterium]